MLLLASCAVEQALVAPPADTGTRPSARDSARPEPVQPEPQPEPEPEPEPEVVVGLLVTELMIDPTAVDDANGEWIELLSTSTADLVLDGLTLRDDGLDDVAVASFVIRPGERLVVCADGDDRANGGVACAGTWTWGSLGDGLALANTGDELEVVLGGVVLDRVVWDDRFSVPGAALGRDDDGQWCAGDAVFGGGDRGTPGSVNPDCP